MDFIDPDAQVGPAQAAPPMGFIDPDSVSSMKAPGGFVDPDQFDQLGKNPNSVPQSMLGKYTKPKNKGMADTALQLYREAMGMKSAAQSTTAGLVAFPAGMAGGLVDKALGAKEGIDPLMGKRIQQFTEALDNNNLKVPSADPYNKAVGEMVNQVLVPLAGVHLGVPQPLRKGSSKLSAKFDALDKIDKNAVPQVPEFQARAEDMALNEQTVNRLQAAVNRQGLPPDVNGTLYTNREGVTMPEAKVPDPYTAGGRPGLDPRAQQMALPFDEQPGQFRSPYALIGEGEGRMDVQSNLFGKDEIPINAARSMEAANLESPLQRNLWGDELPQQHPQEAPRGLTEAIDMIPSGSARDAALASLKDATGTLLSSIAENIGGKLNFKEGTPLREALRDFARSLYDVGHTTYAKAASEAKRILGDKWNHIKEIFAEVFKATKDERVVPKGQRGAINMAIFDPTFEREKTLDNGIVLKFKGNRDTDIPRITAYRDGEVVGKLEFNSKNWVDPNALDNAEAGWVDTKGAPRQGLAPEMYKFASELGNDIVPSGTQTMHGRAMWRRFEASGLAQEGLIPKKWVIPKSQRGGLDFSALNDITESLRKRVVGGLMHLTSKEDFLTKNVPGMEGLRDRVTVSDTPDKIAADSLAPGVKDIPDLGIMANVQSGPILTAAKFRDHPLLLGVGRIMSEGLKLTELMTRKLADPIRDAFRSISIPHRVELAELLKREMFAEKKYTREQLLEAGFTSKQLDAYDMLRAAQKERLDATNAARAKLGKGPITEGNAYLSSMRQGDWQFSVLDKAGKPVWFVRVNTKAEAIAALKHLKDKFGDQLDIDKAKIEFRKDSAKYHPDMPRDVMGAYHDMLEYFKDNPNLSDSIRESMKQFLEDKGYGTLGHKKHFLEKYNIRGFEGDKPWLSPKENANQLLQGQINYLKNAVQWENTQNSMAKLQEILSNKELLDRRPNAMQYIKEIVAQQYGEGKNITGAIERGLASILPAHFGTTVARGRSSTGIYHSVGVAKSLLYLQLLGLNTAHMIATPIQSLITTPAQHRLLTSQGFTHNVAKTTFSAMADFTAGLARHQWEMVTGMDPGKVFPMSELGAAALKYGENNGVIEKNIFRENVKVGEGPITSRLENMVSSTIGIPEKIARLSTFMGFVHHLDASGKFADRMELFRKAEELTDNSLTSFRRHDRPMVVDKFGATGSLAYTFKSYLFNYFNQLSQLSREAARGNPSPLIVHLGALGLVGGVLSMPFVEEMDMMWNGVKDLMSEYMPGQYDKVKGNGLRAAIVENLPDWAAYGAASTALDISLTSRFGTGFGGGLTQPFPIQQDIKEAVGSAKVLTDPNSTTLTHAVHVQLPQILKGQMEGRMDIFKGPNGSAINPNRLEEQRAIDHVRTQKEWEMRKNFGTTSPAEHKDIETGYAARNENERIKTATKNIGVKVFDAIRRNNPEDIKLWAKRYLDLNPSSTALGADVQKHIDDMSLTPTQREMMKAKTAQEIMNVVRLMKTRGQLND